MIEVAKSGRAACRGCKKPIPSGDLRFGDQVPGNFDGMMTFWYHLACAVEHKPEQLALALARTQLPIPNRAALAASLGGATVTARTARLQKVDRAPTGRATCQQCKQSIAKTTLRVTMQRDEGASVAGTSFLHVFCASAFAGADIDAQVTAKAAKADRAQTTAILRTAKLLADDGRGKQLAVRARRAKQPEAEISVLADWLEEHDCALPRSELDQLLATKRR